MFTVNYLQVIDCEYETPNRNSCMGNAIKVAKEKTYEDLSIYQ